MKTGLKEDQLLEIIPQFSALVVRSQTKVTAKLIDAATHLKVIGRAGVGVDNVDVEAATRRGIIVMNTPGGNTISTAEHAFSLLMSLARKIPQAARRVKAGKWDRKSFEGVELYNKTLAILGMGRIGSEVARRAMAFGMRVLAYDPYLSASRARSLQVELVGAHRRYPARGPISSRCTCRPPPRPITCSMPGASPWRRRACASSIAPAAAWSMKPRSSRRCNPARSAARRSMCMKPSRPAADFPLRDLPNVVLTPHLGASTAEAQESVGIEIAQAIRALLLNGEILNAVNMPNIDAKTLEVVGPYLSLGEKLGRLLSQIAPKRCERLNINYSGKVAEADTAAVTRSVLKGYLLAASGPEVNQVNAPALAANLGSQGNRVARERPRGFYGVDRAFRRLQRRFRFRGRDFLRHDAAHRKDQ